MAKRTFQIVGALAAVALAGAVGYTVIAGSSEEDAGFLSHMHAMGQRLHGGGGHHDPMAQLIEELELTPDQLRHFEKVHEIMGADGGHPMVALHERLIAQFEQGRVETGEVRRIVDEHVEQMRGRLYAATDEMITLVDGLDASQREILLAHLRDSKGHDAHPRGHGH